MANYLNIKNSTVLNTVKIDTGELLTLVKVNGLQDEIISFFKSEKKVNEAKGNNKDNLYLTYNENDFALCEFYIFFKGDKIVSFAIRPTYYPECMMRLYTCEDYRKLGLATILLNECETKNLGCLKDNTEAIEFYKNKGFIIDYEYNCMFSLKKE